MGLVAPGPGQRREDDFPLERIEIEAVDEKVGGSARSRGGRVEPQVVGEDLSFARDDEGAFERVLELAHVARGWMRARSGGELHRDDVGSSASAPT